MTRASTWKEALPSTIVDIKPGFDEIDCVATMEMFESLTRPQEGIAFAVNAKMVGALTNNLKPDKHKSELHHPMSSFIGLFVFESDRVPDGKMYKGPKSLIIKYFVNNEEMPDGVLRKFESMGVDNG